MFERKIYSEMLHRKEAFAPKYALFLKGARRVGKTTLAEKLGREAYDSYILLRFDFDNADASIRNLFVESLRDLDTFFMQLQLEYRTQLFPRKSLIMKTSSRSASRRTVIVRFSMRAGMKRRGRRKLRLIF